MAVSNALKRARNDKINRPAKKPRVTKKMLRQQEKENVDPSESYASKTEPYSKPASLPRAKINDALASIRSKTGKSVGRSKPTESKDSHTKQKPKPFGYDPENPEVDDTDWSWINKRYPTETALSKEAYFAKHRIGYSSDEETDDEEDADEESDDEEEPWNPYEFTIYLDQEQIDTDLDIYTRLQKEVEEAKRVLDENPLEPQIGSYGRTLREESEIARDELRYVLVWQYGYETA